MKINRRWPVPLLLTLGLAACATGPGRLEPVGRTVLQVDNQSTLDMTIYVMPETGTRRQLGQAVALMTTNFRIPSNMLFGPTQLRFQADPVGSRRMPVTESVTVTPGDTVVLRIPLNGAVAPSHLPDR